MAKMKSALFAFIILCVLSLSVAAAPTATYTHRDNADGSTTPVLSRETYTAVKTITAKSLGLEDSLEGITDIYCANDGSIYILCGEYPRLIVLNPDYTFHSELFIQDGDGMYVDYTGSQGIMVEDDGTIYIADTNNARILVTDSEGTVQSVLELPESNIIPSDFIYQPQKLARDNKGYTYILSLGSYYGAIMYSPDNVFLGFYGSNTVQATALDTMSFIWDLLTSNDNKKSGSTKKLPYSFVDLCIDNQDYMYTCSGTTTSTYTNGTGQIRRLSPGGSNILYRRSLDDEAIISTNFNFAESKVIGRLGKPIVQNISSIDISDNGFIYALDETYGKIYIYDTDCNLLSAFGGVSGENTQTGLFNSAVSLALSGNSILIADSKNCSVTVFNITEYGTFLQQAQSLYLKGDYTDAKGLWQQVLSMDRGNQLAYRGLSKAYYVEEDYEAAMQYAKNGLDYATYDLAYQYVQKQFVAKNFIWLLPLALLLLGALAVFLIIVNKQKITLIKNEKLHTLTIVSLHPFRAFNNIKYKQQGSLLIGSILLVLFYLTSTLKFTASGFLFTRQTAENYNTLYTLVQTVGLVLLWSLVNWAVCSLFSGKGKLKEVFIATVYALVPVIVYTILYVILSHVLSLSGLTFMNGLYTVVLVFTFFLLSVGIMTVHEFNFFQFIKTGVVTLLGMILSVFIIFMIVILLQQFWNFLYTVYMEVAYR